MPSRKKSDRPAPVDPVLALFSTLPDEAHVRLPVVQGLKGQVSAATIWRWVKAGYLPAPEKLGPNVSAWRVGHLRSHLASLTSRA